AARGSGAGALPLQVAREQMSRGPCVVASREDAREPLVVGLDGHVGRRPETVDEHGRLARLLPEVAPQRDGQPDHDRLRLLVADHGQESIEAGAVADARDRLEGPRERSGRVGHGDAGPRGPVVECQHLHDSLSAISSRARASASGSFSGSLPPARAIVGRPPPPPPTIGAISLTTSPAETRLATLSSKFATRWTVPFSREPSTTAAGA